MEIANAAAPRQPSAMKLRVLAPGVFWLLSLAGPAKARPIRPGFAAEPQLCQLEPFSGAMVSIVAPAGDSIPAAMPRLCARLPALTRCYQRPPAPAPALTGSMPSRLDDPRGPPPTDPLDRKAELSLDGGRVKVIGGTLWPGEATCVERALRGTRPAQTSHRLELSLGPRAEALVGNEKVSLRCAELESWRGGASVVVTVPADRSDEVPRLARAACAEVPKLARCARAGGGQLTLMVGPEAPRPSADPGLARTLEHEVERCVLAVTRKLPRASSAYVLHIELTSPLTKSATGE